MQHTLSTEEFFVSYLCKVRFPPTGSGINKHKQILKFVCLEGYYAALFKV